MDNKMNKDISLKAVNLNMHAPRARFYRSLLLIGLMLVAMSATLTANAATAPTLSFAWYPSTITSGQSTHREWSTTNADSCIGNNGSSVGTSGISKQNVQTSSKTVTMTCYGPGGSVSRSASLTVLPPAPSTPGRPSGSSNVTTNQSFTISWSNVSGATSYRLYKNGSSAYSGSSTSKSQSISSPGSYSYVVKACNSSGCSAASSSRTVAVASPPAPTLSFAWYPSTIYEGETTHREWSSTNADTCIGDNGSSVGTDGISQENVHTESKTVTMTCSGLGGSVSKTITLTVLPPPPPPTLNFAWYPSTIYEGETTHREWSTTNADSCIGDNGSSVGTSGVSQENVHTVNKTVTMTCYGAGGEVSKTITLTVNSALPDRVTTVLGPNEAEANTPFSISWDAMPNTDTYTVLVKSGAAGEAVYQIIDNVSGTSTDVSHNAEEVIIIRVQACNFSGCGPESGARIVNVLAPPPLPDRVTTVLGPNEAEANTPFTISWDAMPNTDTYTVLVKSGASGEAVYQKIEGVGGASIDVSHNAEEVIIIRVQACNVTGCGPESGARIVNVLAPQILGTATLTLPTDNQSVTGALCFDWEPAENASHYTVQVSNDTNFNANSQRWILRDLDTTNVCWSSNFIANPTAGTTPEGLPNGTFYWRIKSMDNDTFGTPSPNATFSAHRGVTILGATWEEDTAVVGQAVTITGLNSSVSYCATLSEAALRFNYDPTTTTATFYSASDSLLNDWQCFDESEAFIQAFSAPITINKLSAPLNLKEQNNE
jgi:hypothetical protein